MGKVYDLAVIGGGIVGLAHAITAARRGQRVVLIERERRANGASIRNFGFVTVTGQERGESWALARRTRDVWAEIAPLAGITVEHRGLYVSARSDEAMAVIKAFLATEMGDGCQQITADAFRAATGGLGSADLLGALYSPHELRMESRDAIPLLTRWATDRLGIDILTETVAFSSLPPILHTSRGTIAAAQVVVCPGDDFSTLWPDRIAAYNLRRCRLSMLRLADPGIRLPGALMSDLSLTRYAGYAALPQAAALKAKLVAEQPRHYANGVHLIVAQGSDGTLIVGDSHHYDDLPGPFAPASAEHDILDEYVRATGRPAPAVIERWVGTYASADDRTHLIDTPADDVRLVIVTGGTGASTSFGIAEKVLNQLMGTV
jgi:FAD dependent oxidoreductase TIGR03364